MIKLTKILSVLVIFLVIPLSAWAANSAFSKYEADRPPSYAQCKQQYGLPIMPSDEAQYIVQLNCCEYVNSLIAGICNTNPGAQEGPVPGFP